ncbi:hypothetical protein J4Q44_G00121840 [Coregonus suidteri]|uniref:Uncharacterized protein n=1 Tax=Coregonus suidteri TaxID=861788 RepID=A0AAN8LV47_9TELE
MLVGRSVGPVTERLLDRIPELTRIVVDYVLKCRTVFQSQVYVPKWDLMVSRTRSEADQAQCELMGEPHLMMQYKLGWM